MRHVKLFENFDDKPEWVDSLERRLNRSIDINRDKPFTDSPQASVRFNGQYVDIEIMYENFMTDSDGVGILMKDIVSRVVEEIGEENGIEFKFKSHNVASYMRAKHAKDSYDSRDFRQDSYRLNFKYEVIEQLSERYEFDEEAPFSITIELTDEFEERTEQSKNSDGASGYTSMGSHITLVNNGERYNMVKVATIPWDIQRNIQFDFWASYMPQAEEIYVTQSSATVNDLKRLDNAAYRDELRSGQPILSDTGENGNSLFSPGYYCKFENGFKVGEVDHRGYFRIVEVK